MKAVKGSTKESYRELAPIAKDFETIEKASEYLASKYNQSKEYMTRSILDDTNCDAIFFDDNSVIILEF
ncbi:MAG: hypothetical protein UIC64_05775 [Agathobacter sp.]|nr:hypothetical protein [Agathobacter sp.]